MTLWESPSLFGIEKSVYLNWIWINKYFVL